MYKYKFVEHTADVRMHLQGDSLNELFQAGLEGLSTLLTKKTLKTKISQEITCKAHDTTSLLVEFLSAVLTLSHIHQAVFDTIEFTTLTDKSIQAKVHGKKVDGFTKDVKAITYHEAEIVQNKRGILETTIVCDI